MSVMANSPVEELIRFDGSCKFIAVIVFCIDNLPSTFLAGKFARTIKPNQQTVVMPCLYIPQILTPLAAKPLNALSISF
jgi:hypothetical protein